ncbi:c-type cytochrome biogenesis protein CcmI [Erwinia pyrifoliae]|uniref:c-type cytochrome biogenesis protein CcmI n=1 Tax=Erwinia pyrifoliae TaxID=79967 RepID=UPI0001960FB1|nr:c-type cytochrome biogenesis protein CcmI [Erwinia pyrifoliae]AUX73266.1 c-type cytochrome biogenesis protein CcmI [Erwinia pyrifoliae]MCA8876446.1 c-type cytochrome biogenesis protein CcmI [Erwinia pyrifoliae]UXK11207.1 c-type cytochrome biogenesis protein CcmI [Erwinia pyrifoliae]CAX54976.1 cytochrome c-type biogenesis protein [Erwinia pyrifoliae Ep1/96]CAY73656.1 Cytochrome c-type biogenesis protein ccmI [Erwinia pyrifoliae DSM 12163]
MSGFWLLIALLLLASCTLVVLAGSRSSTGSAPDRDTLNQRFYHQRLRELEDDEAQGVVDGRPEIIHELQQALLMDIPEQPAAQRRQISRWVLLPGVLVLLLVCCGVYFKAGGLQQLLAWQQVQNELPVLRARAMNPNARPLTMEQLARLALGVRSELQQSPDNFNDWMLLGRLGMVLNNASTASQAFRRALQLSPNDTGARMSYAEVLARSGDPQDNREASAILNEMVSHDRRNLQLLGLLAFNNFSLQNYAQAMDIWQKMLQLLAADDGRVALIQRSIAEAKSALGGQENRLALTVRLSDAAEKMLPLRGVLYISVTDGNSPIPVAVKEVPLSHFPLSLTLDDSNAMMPDRLLSAQRQLQVRVRISRDGSAHPQPGDWYGLSAVTPFTGQQQLAVDINRQ